MKTMQAAEQSQKELIEMLQDSAEKEINFSLKKQKNEDLFFQYGIQTVTDSFMNVDSKRESRQIRLQKRLDKIVQLYNEIQMERDHMKIEELASQPEITNEAESPQKANPFGTSQKV